MNKAELIAQFGSEEALGVRFLVTTSQGLVGPLTAPQLKILELTLGEVDIESQFVDGLSATCCTNYAIQVCRAYPGRTQIHGFANADNPDALIVREGLHPGGHDFAIIDKRFLVDPWLKLVSGYINQVVFDLNTEFDCNTVRVLYGSAKNWKRMFVAENEANGETK